MNIKELDTNINDLKWKIENLVKEREDILEAAWEILQCLEDTDNEYVYRACVKLVERYGLDPNALPSGIYNRYLEEISNDLLAMC
jgi:hypothetical protein